MVDRRDDTPLKLQLADAIAADIQGGVLKPGQRLPSEAELQRAHGMSRGTVRSAMGRLRERGLVYTIQARGTFVRGE